MVPKRTQLSIALTAAFLSSTMSMGSMAQTATPKADIEKAETVVVTGYRAAIEKALEIKLASNAIMESIVADDIGKLPEQNIAEAISRVPGVTISRSKGEGQFVSVRGLGSNFNSALLNGRILATENQGREYSFDILPAELINSVDIFKSPTAGLAEGGIGATINMKTAQPLDIGNKFVLSTQGNYDQQRGKASPQASGLYSMKSADGTFGALAAFSYLDRKIEGRRTFTDGFEAGLTAKDASGKALTGVSAPTWTEYDINDTNRKRASGLATVQWRPSDALTITVDGLYSKLDVNDNSTIFYAGSYNGAMNDAVADANKTLTNYRGGWGEGVVNFIRPRLAETKAAGLNVKWKHSPALTSEFDFASSKATDKNGGNQTWFDINLNAPGFDSANLKYQLGPNNLPIYSNLGNIYDTSRATMNGLVWEGMSVEDKVSQASYTGKYKMAQGVVKSLDFGLNYSDRDKSRTRYDTPGAWGLFEGVKIPQSMFSSAANSVNFMGSGMFTQNFPSFDARAVQAYLLTPAVINQTKDPVATRAFLAKHGAGLDAEVVPGASGSAREKTSSGFLQANFAGDMGDRGWGANLGLRYVGTDVIAKGVGQEILGINRPAPGQTGEATILLSPAIPLTAEGSYKEWLPSANFKIDVADNLLLQAAAARSMTRATLSDLVIAREINARIGELRIKDGNPGLKPMMAWNYDLSLTWYNGKGSSLSGAIFSKNLSNLAERKTSIVSIVGEKFALERPENMGKNSLTGVELGGQYMLTGALSGFGVLGNFTYVGQANTKTYNLGAFYEKGPVEVRVAYNYRNAYRETDSGRRGQPEDIAAYGDVNGNISYAVNKNLTVFAQGINLTNAKIHSYSIYETRVINYEAYGRRFALGARMSF